MNPNQKKDPYTQVKFRKEAVDAVYEGVREVAEAVATTLGPSGRNVLLDKGYETIIIHDGVNVSIAINPEEPFKRSGAKVMQEATKRMRDLVGDGTSAVCVLTKAILDKTLEATASGINPMSLRRGLETGAQKVVKAIQNLSIPIKTLEQKIQIATISAEDEDLGKLVAETVHKTGDDGVITIEESKGSETIVEQQDGMQVDKGLVHYMLMTDPERQLAILEEASVLITDMPLMNIPDFAKFIDNEILKKGIKKCLFISPEMGGDFIASLVGLKINGQFLGLGMRAPGIGSIQMDMLQDLCALTGATLVSKDAGHKLNEMTMDVLGTVKRVQQTKSATILIGGGGHRDDILSRIQVIREQLKDETIGEWEHEQLRGRLAKLTNGVAVIKVGGQTEVEMKERKERADDAVCATQAAVKSGLIPGGEVVYLTTLHELDENNLGEKILKEALVAPFKRLVENAGYDGGEKLSELRVHLDKNWANQKLKKTDDWNVELDPKTLKHTGFDVIDGKFKDMIKSGIVDPSAVPITAVKTAVSVATQLSSLGAAVVLQNEEKS